MSHRAGPDFPLIVPDWEAPPNVRSASTTRHGGLSVAPFDALNLSASTGDDELTVDANRQRLAAMLGLPATPHWLRQVHATRVVEVTPDSPRGTVADAAFTVAPGCVCVVLTADCLPVLLCDRAGTRVGAAHAGWRGLAAGVLERSVEALAVPADSIRAWLGPAIGPDAFEVGPEVRESFLAVDPGADSAFRPGTRSGRWLADLYALARRRLLAAGVGSVHGGGRCTHGELRQFYSHRRDGPRTGRMASLVWIEP